MRQTLKQAVKLTNRPGTDMARAACALDGCPVGGWPETNQAMQRIREYLPGRIDRNYSLGSFIEAVYYVDSLDRYRTKGGEQ